MKRGGPLKRKTPLQTRTPIRPRKPGSGPRSAAHDTGEPRTAVKPRKPLKLRYARIYRTPARKSAKGRDCTICLPGCPNATETVVLCHIPRHGGGGMGIKPHDCEAVYGDSYCHDRIDGRVKLDMSEIELADYLLWALIRTHRIMRAEGILVMKGEE